MNSGKSLKCIGLVILWQGLIKCTNFGLFKINYLLEFEVCKNFTDFFYIRCFDELSAVVVVVVDAVRML